MHCPLGVGIVGKTADLIFGHPRSIPGVCPGGVLQPSLLVIKKNENMLYYILLQLH